MLIIGELTVPWKDNVEQSTMTSPVRMEYLPHATQKLDVEASTVTPYPSSSHNLESATVPNARLQQMQQPLPAGGQHGYGRSTASSPDHPALLLPQPRSPVLTMQSEEVPYSSRYLAYPLSQGL